MKTDLPHSFRRLEYSPPTYTLGQVALDIALDPAHTIVKSRLEVLPGPHHAADAPLILQGEELEFVSLRVNGEVHRQFELSPGFLKILALPDGGQKAFIVEIICACAPATNTSLMGLYVSNGNFFTQCEAEGFRKITYFLDRPDVMARYRVTLRAIEADYPVLLSNGNLIDTEKLPNGWHLATWEDPFPKPSYLFALVAGKLECLEETITTSSGATKLLQIWVEPADLKKTRHAMDSLIAAIHWDEKRFGLELDLERFMIVAVSDFNMGAMENKGLNIFNTKFILAQPETATDADFANIESVVAHEYFHNWTGNRVTCRDWFQLSLKEGLTVFRDQEFSADQMGSESGRAVRRIDDVRVLRQLQFPEDAGPMAHPIRPDEYEEINNFYTVTVYEKGAEVVRMYQTLLGVEGFRKGMDLYFQRHDGHAVTCDDFLAAMADANGRDLSRFKYWYSQSGTPKVHVAERYDASLQQYHLTLSQSCTPGDGQTLKNAFHIPLKMRLLTASNDQAEQLLELTQENQTWVFEGLAERPALSLNRGFSAPIQLKFAQSQDDLMHLFFADDDAFNRWESGQTLAMQLILDNHLPDSALIDAYRHILTDPDLDPAFKELALSLPAESYLYEQCVEVDPQHIHNARRAFRHAVASELRLEWAALYQQMQTPGPFSPDAVSAAKRALKNCALNMLLEADPLIWAPMAVNQYQTADNMTDRYGALAALVICGSKEAQACLKDFYTRFEGDTLVIDKWFALQASRPPVKGAQSTLEAVQQLRQHAAFKMNNPNRVRSVIHAYCLNNPASFHLADGSGYVFWAEAVLALNAVNPQIAARLARGLDRWRNFAQPFQSQMLAALQRVATSPGLSADVREVINKAIGAGATPEQGKIEPIK
ncbi:aminopeptidase N [Polynucleobacter meluiroseus]|uniref:Aminopeptidase N n=1 Tax=Polynucleobacter meluiroseus TaxID=1938814 RepID=A0A240E245_9BURK|nr:aminopeptidase N [Polynucleobacter meluiroseus]SNX29282.1 aminopeptidase N [Polynucleobacter meluiroseus]